jgi:serine phosphatase RsbU (regulator of sigma subunit)
VEYGEKRLGKLILENINLSLDNLCDLIIKDVTDFEGENRFDDITLLAMKRIN